MFIPRNGVSISALRGLLLIDGGLRKVSECDISNYRRSPATKISKHFVAKK